MTDGVQCWGQNKFGQLGNGTKTDQHLPGDVTGLKSGIEEIAVGASHACALTSVGKVMCWGNNHYGGVGDGTQIDRETPVEVAAITDVKHIAAGSSHTCALTDQGGVYCWGWSSSAVAFGDPETGAPRLIKGLDKGVQAIALGGDFACVLTDEGGVKCWGNIEVDQPDPGFTTSSDKPQNVTGLTSDVVAISAGDAFACALTRTGTVKCWGDNENGQLGNGSVIDKL
jgi:alpha-tubulin suppressor-like RCC1 family protein